MAKKPGEPIGVMLIESGWGSMLPTCVIGHMAKAGPAALSNKVNIGEFIFISVENKVITLIWWGPVHVVPV